MKKLLWTTAAVLLAALPTAAADSPQPFKTIGEWTVVRSLDAMTDAPSCFAIYKDNYQIQLGDDSFAVMYRGRGGVAGYTIRLDSEPAWSMRLPTSTEKSIGAFILEGAEYQQVIKASRIRIQTLTVLSQIVNDDVDLTDSPAILEVLNSADCK